MKLLVVVAHPDDEVIICGATIDKLIKSGHQVHVSYCSQNEEAYFASESSSKRALRTKKEANNSAKCLGFSCSFLGFKDMHLEFDLGKLIKSVIHEIRNFEPDIIITHYSKDKHIDHRTLGSVVAEANFQSGCELCGGRKIWSAKLVLQGEVDLEMSTPFAYQVVSSVSKANLIKKLEAFKFYETVMSEHHTTSKWLFKKLETLATLRGKTAGYKYGEAFIVDNYSPLNYQSLKMLLKLTKL
ncbi:MAG TPA: PIG-L family deacetylase [Candidatus Methanoperedens sp.]|nr:PIG-L family deacetylase [Candidatus Methanoperedens sp.]